MTLNALRAPGFFSLPPIDPVNSGSVTALVLSWLGYKKNCGTNQMILISSKIYDYNIVIILTSGSGAIEVKLNIIRMLSVLPSEITKISS